MSWADRFAVYRDQEMANIEGWVQKDLLDALAILQKFHDDNGVVGHLVEIGVHHGKLALALDRLRRAEEKLLAVDIFDDQKLNVDRSGRGSREIFEAHVARYSHDPAGIIIKSGDSLLINPDDIRRDLGGMVRMFSIDGGHTLQHALNDLTIAASVTNNGGVVVLDDFCSAGFAGVTEALFRYLYFHTPKILPFAYMGGRLLLTTVAYRDTLHNHLIKRTRHMERKFRVTPICGYPTICVTPAKFRPAI